MDGQQMNIIELVKKCGACDDDSSAWGELFTFEPRELAQFARAIYEDAAAILDANADKEGKRLAALKPEIIKFMEKLYGIPRDIHGAAILGHDELLDATFLLSELKGL